MASPADWPPGARPLALDLDGPVSVLEWPGPPGAAVLACLHGLGGSALNYGLVGPVLARTHRVLVLDLLGHGDTRATGPTGAGALEAQLHLVDRFVREVAGPPVVLVGHSLGGVLALLQAERAPETVSRLVLLDPPVPHAGSGRTDLRLSAKLALLHLPGVRAAVARQVARSSPEDLVRRQLDQATPYADRVAPEAVAASVAQTRRNAALPQAADAQRAQWAAVLATMALLRRARAWRRRVAALDLPVLWLQGEDDRLVPLRDATALARRRADVDLRTRAGVGHLPHLEDPRWTAGAITGWLG